MKPVATAKPAVVADEEKQSRTFLAEYQANVADPTEWIKKKGGDPPKVAANIIAWKQRFEGSDQNDPADPTQEPGGKDPRPAPPGSAGGDGSSPNEPRDIFGTASERAGPHKYSSTHIELTGEAGPTARPGPPDPRRGPAPDDGREDDPTSPPVRPHDRRRRGRGARSSALRPGPLAPGRVSFFPATDKRPSDVLKIEVDSPDLHRLNAALATLPHVEKFHLKPHATIAYVKPGTGAIYVWRRSTPSISTSNRAGSSSATATAARR